MYIEIEGIDMAEVRKLICTQKNRSLGEIVGVIKAGLSSEFVCEAKMLNGNAVLLCFEQFYFRCSNYVSLSIMLTENEECQEAVVAGFGGGDGLLNMSYGANKSFASKAVKCLCRVGFLETK